METNTLPLDDSPAASTTITQDAVKKPLLQRHINQNLMNLIVVLLVSSLLLIGYIFSTQGYPLYTLKLLGSSLDNANVMLLLLPLRVGLGFVFFWYGIDNFEHPQIFNNLFNILLKKAKIEKNAIDYSALGYLQSVCEILVGISLVSGIFIDIGSLLGSLLLIAVLFAYEEGLGSLIIRDIGLLGATFSIFLFTVFKI